LDNLTVESFDWQFINKTGGELPPEGDPLMRLALLYTDFYNFAHNKMIWHDANKVMVDVRNYLEEKGLVINALDHKLGEIRE
jgi:hypothetical protein